MRRFIALALVLTAAACQQAPPPAPPVASKPPVAAAPAPSAREPAPATVAKAPLALPSLEFPSGPLYFCQSSSGRMAIDYEPRVEQLCRRHPEMGPCQYERNACRTRGGRVFAAGGVEITSATEAEYDKKVMRTRFRAN